jgi:[acyl-carrier-protein] S-malonyltransferase
VLERIVFRDPILPLFSNVSGGRVGSGAEAKALARLHITSPVRWTAEEAAIAEMGEAVIEAGPGKVLQGLWKDAPYALPCYGMETIK